MPEGLSEIIRARASSGKILFRLCHRSAYATVRGKNGLVVGQEVVRESPDLVFHQVVDDPLGLLSLPRGSSCGDGGRAAENMQINVRFIAS